MLISSPNPSQAEWEAYVHEVVPLNFETDKGPVTGIEGKLPASSGDVTGEQITPLACFLDDGDEVISNQQFQLKLLPMYFSLGVHALTLMSGGCSQTISVITLLT